MTGRVLTADETETYRRLKAAGNGLHPSHRKKLREASAPTIHCPCCGSDTGIPVVTAVGGMDRITPEQIALRERMRRAGIPRDRIMDWTRGRVRD